MTNSNKNVATKIIDYCKITDFIDYITIGNECKKSKPYPDPYLETIAKYNVNKNQCIIFEDSKLTDVSIENADILEIRILNSNLNNVDFSGSYFNNFKIYNLK